MIKTPKTKQGITFCHGINLRTNYDVIGKAGGMTVQSVDTQLLTYIFYNFFLKIKNSKKIIKTLKNIFLIYLYYF
jgi:hypothetical protein